MAILVAGGIWIWGIVAGGPDTHKPMGQVQCEDLIPQVISLSEDNQNALRPAILKVYDARRVSRSASRVECEGRAKMSRGDMQGLIFYLEEDSDGDRFIGYEGTGPDQ